LQNGNARTTDTEVAVIVVNYGTAALTIAAVESVLARDHGGRGVEIHVVDNASPGDDAEVLARAHEDRGWVGRVTLWPETENHGFGRGNNLILHHLSERDKPPVYAFLLNPDAALENEAIDILAAALEANLDAAAAGAGISFPDGSPAVACFRFPTLIRELVTTINFGPLEKLLPSGRTSLPPDWTGPIDWVAGASVLMRLDHLSEVGFFDPDFFLYYEEVELMWRLRRAGYRALYVPQARVTHIAGAATQVASHDKRAKPSPAFVYESWRMYYVKSHGRLYALTLAFLKFPAAWISKILSRMRGDPSILPARFSRDHWRHVVRPLLLGTPDG